MKKPYFGLDYKGLDKYAQYQVYFSDPSGFSNNFHDSYYQQYHSPGQFYLADEFGQMGLMKYRVECMDRYNWGAGRAGSSLVRLHGGELPGKHRIG